MTEASRVTARELRQFGIVMAVGLAAIGAILLWRHRPAAPALLGAAAVFLAAGLAAPRALAPVRLAWLTVAGWISVVMTHVVLTLAYFIVFVPLGLLFRLLGKDPLQLRFEPGKASYWEKVDPNGPASRPDKPY